MTQSAAGLAVALVATLLGCGGPQKKELPLHARALLYTGDMHYQRGAYQLAANALEQALLYLRDWTEDGDDIPLEVSARKRLGMTYLHMGDLERADEQLKLALRLQRNFAGRRHISTVPILRAVAQVQHERGAYAESLALYRQCLDLLASRPGGQLDERRAVLAGQARVYESRGQYRLAMDTHRRALDTGPRAASSKDPAIAESLASMASLHEIRGEYAESLRLYQRALTIVGKDHGVDHPAWAAAVQNIAAWHQRRGEYERALSLHEQAVDVQRRVLGEEHPKLADSLVLLASLYRWRGRHDEALGLYRQARAIALAAYGPEHAAVARILDQMALAYVERGQYNQALPLHERALRIRRQALGADHAAVATSLGHLGHLHLLRGDFASARRALQASLELARKTLGADHPDTAEVLGDLSALAWAQGDKAGALDHWQERLRITELAMDALSFAASADQKHTRFAAHQREAQLVVALHLQDPDNDRAADLALQTVLRRKAFVLGRQALELRSARLLGQTDRKLLDELAETRAQLAHLVLRGPRGHTRAYRIQTESLWNKVDTLETRISSLTRRYHLVRSPVTVPAVRAELDADSALVEFVTYAPVLARPGAPQVGQLRYAAYILTSVGAPTVVDLGDAAAIDAAAGKLRTSLRRYLADVKIVARALDALVMAPVRAHLDQRQRKVYLAPDGALNFIPFEALVDERERYLVERFSFTYLDSGRQLVQRAASAPVGRSVTIVAAPAFDHASADASEPGTTRAAPSRSGSEGGSEGADAGAAGPTRASATRGRRSRDMGERVFPHLPGALREASALRGLFPGATVLLGTAATEAAIKRARSPGILHIATHGFFLPDQDIGPAPKRVFWSRRQGALTAARGAPMETPLIRSGLALAGANHLRSGDEDGILTALELSSVALQGTQLAVLSACDTGMGAAKLGKGVFGLRRALVLAGAATQMVSLWTVDDRATSALMQQYYGRLLAGEGRSEALHNVQRAFLRSRDRAHPHFWAGFIVSGDPSPLAL